MPEIPYSRQTVCSPNPLARFTHRRRHATALRLTAASLPHGGALLDLGCGDGHFLRQCGRIRPDLRLFGFDPGWEGRAEGFVLARSLAELPDGVCDAVCAFEVLEHLDDPELAEFFEQSRRILPACGLWILSVPIIGGPTLLLKELNRALLFRRPSDYTLGELARAAFLGVPAPRASDRKRSHKGFDFRALERRLGREGKILVRRWSPFRWAPWWMNSQVFYVVERGD